jgi:hypothetical protein
VGLGARQAKHQHWVHRLGNLTLLSRKKNSSASNYEFELEEVAYFTKGGVNAFALTTQVLKHNGLDRLMVMQERQDEDARQAGNALALQDRKSKAAGGGSES